jgi:hypothetical protein
MEASVGHPVHKFTQLDNLLELNEEPAGSSDVAANPGTKKKRKTKDATTSSNCDGTMDSS